MRIKHKIKKRFKPLFIFFFLTVISIFLSLVILETILKTDYFDNINNPCPIWISDKYKKIDDKINTANKAAAQNNSFLFNDLSREIKKKEDFHRITVLVNSYILGDGVPYETIWNHKLETTIKKHFDNIIDRVLNDWGHENWKKNLYSRENPEEYTKLLSNLSIFVSINNLQSLIILTPGSHPSSHCKKYDSIIRCIKKANIKCLNLYPTICYASKRQFRANLTNPHPGHLLTSIYSKEVFDYLLKTILSNDKLNYHEKPIKLPI